MKTKFLSSVALAIAAMLLGTPMMAVAQFSSPGADPHHPDQAPAAGAPADAPSQPAAPSPQPGMGMGMGMMGPQMMQMMPPMMQNMPQGMMGMGGAAMGRNMGGMQGQMQGMMAAMPGIVYGTPTAELTAARVTEMVEGLLAWHGNPRLKLGEVSAAGDGGEIVAEIVTQDGSVVQKLAFNRFPGLVRQVP